MQLLYFTFNELPGGVFRSQVIEVVQEVGKTKNIRLLALVPLRGFFQSRSRIKALAPDAIVFPAFPGWKRWQWNRFWLRVSRLFFKVDAVICRGPFATNLAIDSFGSNKVIYDGRGAVWAEHAEYGVYKKTGIGDDIFAIEKKAVLQSSGKIAVTKQLIQYWRDNFNYSGNDFTVIPCTISVDNKKGNNVGIPPSVKFFLERHQQTVRFVFSGGTGKWQALDKVTTFLRNQLLNNPDACAVLLCGADNSVEELKKDFGERIFHGFLSPNEIHPVLSECDYAILFREDNTTNRVASPVKAAEYLYAGLKVIISPNVGEYSELVAAHNLGVVVDQYDQYIPFKVPTEAEKFSCRNFAEKFLSKSIIDLTPILPDLRNR